jgi:fluoride exporter
MNVNAIAVGAGGFFGAILRYLLGEWVHPADGFPLGTLIVNLLGCLFLAWFFTVTTRRWKISPTLRLSVGTGFTGAFTTFSTFSVETLHLLQNHQFGYAMTYVLLSVIGGIALAVFGARLASITGTEGGTQ